MSNDALTIKELAEKAAGIITAKDGREYSYAAGLHAVYHDPMPEPVTVRNLTSLVDYVNEASNKQELEKDGCFVLVGDPGFVVVHSRLNKDSMKRKAYIQADLRKQEGFAFGQWYGHEDFIIKLNSLFEPVGDHKTLVEFLSRLSIEDGIVQEDNGVSQSATIKSGVSGALKARSTAPSRVTLTPFRTFNEVKQPHSEFLFRMKKDHSGGVSCGLFEAEGGAWKNRCVEKIKAYLEGKITGSFVIMS